MGRRAGESTKAAAIGENVLTAWRGASVRELALSRVELQFFYFVFELEFFALQFVELQIVRRKVAFFQGDRSFDGLVAAHEFRQMRFEGHWQTPLSLFDSEIVVTTRLACKPENATGSIK
jgi:hypothetical protein